MVGKKAANVYNGVGKKGSALKDKKNTSGLMEIKPGIVFAVRRASSRAATPAPHL